MWVVIVLDEDIFTEAILLPIPFGKENLSVIVLEIECCYWSVYLFCTLSVFNQEYQLKNDLSQQTINQSIKITIIHKKR